MNFLEKVFIADTENTFIQLIRYTFVGGAAFLFDISTLYLLTELAGWHYLLAAAVGFMVGILVNYILSIIWIFKTRRLQRRSTEFFLFLVIGIIGLLLNEGLIWFFTEIVMLYYLLSKVVAAFIVYFWNFFARKYLLYTKG
jgi:putative flippase GtrA